MSDYILHFMNVVINIMVLQTWERCAVSPETMYRTLRLSCIVFVNISCGHLFVKQVSGGGQGGTYVDVMAKHQRNEADV